MPKYLKFSCFYFRRTRVLYDGEMQVKYKLYQIKSGRILDKADTRHRNENMNKKKSMDNMISRFHMKWAFQSIMKM